MSKTEKKHFVGNVYAKVKGSNFVYLEMINNSHFKIPLVGDDLANELRLLADEIDKRKREEFMDTYDVLINGKSK